MLCFYDAVSMVWHHYFIKFVDFLQKKLSIYPYVM